MRYHSCKVCGHVLCRLDCVVVIKSMKTEFGNLIKSSQKKKSSA